jgi:D,D-heptose 1,7-bisphosphate phosphatase
MYKAIFLDKDNTAIPDIPYNIDPTLITLTEGAGEALHRLQRERYRLVMITNQAGVARGYFAEEAIAGVEAKMRALLRPFGVELDGFYYCPHHPEGTIEPYAICCDCRKPAPGMLLRAAADLDIDLGCSWMLGDIASDIHAGHNAGCTTILFAQYCDKEKEIQAGSPHFVADTFADVARLILETDATTRANAMMGSRGFSDLLSAPLSTPYRRGCR